MISLCPRCHGKMVNFDEGRWMCQNYKSLNDRNIEPNCSFFIDLAGLNFLKKELIPAGYYQMANEPLAEGYYHVLKQEYPNIQMIKHGIGQYFILTDEGKAKVYAMFMKEKNRHEEALNEINKVLPSLRK